MPEEKRLSVPMVAKRLGVSSNTTTRIIERGELRATRIGGRWLVWESDLQEYERTNTNLEISSK